MTIIIVLALLMASGGLVYILRGTQRTSGLAVSARLGRYGGAGTFSGGDVSSVISPHVRQQSEQSAVSRGVERVVGEGRFGRSVGRRLEYADIKMTPGEFLSLCVAILVISMLGGLLLFGGLGLLAGAIIAGVGPWFYLNRRIKKRRNAFLEQLPDMAQMMGNSMRAGFSILQSMELVGHEAPKPGSDEFERVVTEVKLGLTLETALDHLQQRMPGEEIELAVVAINVQRQVGGNLAEILMVIAHTVRERVRFKRDLRTLTAQARYSSYIITGLPISVGVVINFMDRPYESFLYTSTLGHIMLGISICMLALGFFFLSKIADIEV